ncbi:MAG: U32 family peptidase [Victivallaceae bacterium]|nr:U32 family peptidase [Victivallaceae bacterium]
MNTIKTPELLAPAGNLRCALAAFDAGADAVYAGLGKFNARERGENFESEELLALIEYAHAHGKKVYLAFNTLLKESELEEAAAMLGSFYDAFPDAVLVQDLGLAKIIRDYFPELTMHASTQMGIHNLEGLEIAAKLGFKRAVLERQLTLDEIRLIAAKSPIELEVFIHGALCCSLSGECLFSSWSGGCSGNRGKCKQPCRRRYFSKQGNGFFFSTADLCATGVISELRKLNIASFKIEGRLRQADYVFNTVSAYRKLVDAPEIDRKVTGEARNLLAESCGRKWSDGFYSDSSMRELIQYKALGASGAPCGRVEDVADNGFGFIAARRIHLGDRVRVQPASGDEGPSLTITKMFVNNAPATVASRGDRCFICCDKPVEFKGLVYKIGRAAPDPKLRRLPVPRRKLNASFHFSSNGGFSGKVTNTVPPIEFSCPIELRPALNQALTPGMLGAELALRGDDAYASGALSCMLDGNYFLPLSELKKLRNKFWDHVLSSLGTVELPPPGALNLAAFRAAVASRPVIEPDEGYRRETVAVSPSSATFGNPKARMASSIFSYTKHAEELILPDFCPPEKIERLRRLIAEAVASGVRRFRVCGLYAFALFNGDRELVTGYGIPVCNSWAAELLRELGAGQVMAHVELEKAALEQLVSRSPLPVEIYRFGRIPLLSTRAALPVDGEIRDAHGAGFMILRDGACGLFRLYSSKVMSVPRLRGASDFYDLTNAHWGAKDTGDFNFYTELT